MKMANFVFFKLCFKRTNLSSWGTFSDQTNT